MKSRIICIGNRFLAGDVGGPAVFDRLRGMSLPDGIDLIEGGLSGLNLLPLLEQGGRVVFVDTVAGFAKQGTVVILDQASINECLNDEHYGHDAGLPYLLSVLPKVCDGELPEEIVLVGLEGECDDELIDKASELSLSIAVNGFHGDLQWKTV